MSEVSIIMPINNSEVHISQCMESILNQSYHDIDIILVDNGCTDLSVTIIQEYKQRYPEKIQIITLQNQEISVARNAGISQSDSSYVLFVDPKDYLEELMIERMIESAIENNSDLVLCNARVVKEDNTFIKVWNSGDSKEDAQSLFMNKSLLNKIPPTLWGKLFRRTLFTEYNITFPLGLRNGELSTFPKLLCHCNAISKVNRAFYDYTYQKQPSIKIYDHKILDVTKNLMLVKRYYISQGLMDEFRDQIEYFFIDHLLFNAMDQVKNVEDVSLREELMGSISETLNKEFPTWYKNKTISTLPRAQRRTLNQIKRGNMGAVMHMLRLKTKLGKSYKM